MRVLVAQLRNFPSVQDVTFATHNKQRRNVFFLYLIPLLRLYSSGQLAHVRHSLHNCTTRSVQLPNQRSECKSDNCYALVLINIQSQ